MNRTGFAAAFWVVLLTAPLLARAPVRLWVEAEGFTTSTETVRTGAAAFLTSTTPLEESYQRGLESASQVVLNQEEGQRISGERYIWNYESLSAFNEGQRRGDAPMSLAYTVSVPQDDDYYLWVRLSNPPPCYSHFGAWFGDADPGEGMDLLSGTVAVWVWWGWGTNYNDGEMVPFRLTAGEHTLRFGYAKGPVRLDKFLLTNDPAYVPFGAGTSHYTRTFEPSHWSASGHGHGEMLPASDSGWLADPRARWRVEQDAAKGNHLYAVQPTANDQNPDLAVSLVEGLQRDLLEARVSIERLSADALVLFGWNGPDDFDGVRIENGRVDLVTVRPAAGERVLATAPVPGGETGRLRLKIQRDRTEVRVFADGQKIISLPGAFPRRGGAGLASQGGGVAFDDASFEPLANSSASFSLQPLDAAAKENLRTLKGEPLSQSLPADGTLLIYQAPACSDCELTIPLQDEQSANEEEEFDILFPYMSPQAHLTLRVRRGVGSVLLTDAKGIELASATWPDNGREALIRYANGVYSLFVDGANLLEWNDYEGMGAGTFAFSAKTSGTFPIRSLKLEPSQTFGDNFVLTATAKPGPQWTEVEGQWRVVPASQSGADNRDGQLVATQPGFLEMGEADWLAVQLQTYLLLDQSTKAGFAVQSRPEEGKRLEVLISPTEFLLQYLMPDGSRLTHLGGPLGPLDSGWHRLAFSVAENGAALLAVDDQVVLRTQLNPSPGAVGLVSAIGVAVFDNSSFSVLARSVVSERGEGEKQLPLPLHIDLDSIQLQ
ncbi:MAG: hypothetical protein RLY93_02805 [Sumerlaeia bacterium]